MPADVIIMVVVQQQLEPLSESRPDYIMDKLYNNNNIYINNHPWSNFGSSEFQATSVLLPPSTHTLNIYCLINNDALKCRL